MSPWSNLDTAVRNDFRGDKSVVDEHTRHQDCGSNTIENGTREVQRTQVQYLSGLVASSMMVARISLIDFTL